MEEVTYQVTSSSRNGIRIYFLGRKPIPLDLRYSVCQLEQAERLHKV